MKKGLIILAILVVIKLLLDIGFKIRYSDNNNYTISDYRLNDSIYIESGSIYFGKNIKGNLEASLFPGKILISDKVVDIDYIYFRLFPAWYKSELQSGLKKMDRDSVVESLLIEAKNNHESYFKDYMHFNNYPIVKKDFMPFVIKFKDRDNNIRLINYIK